MLDENRTGDKPTIIDQEKELEKSDDLQKKYPDGGEPDKMNADKPANLEDGPNKDEDENDESIKEA